MTNKSRDKFANMRVYLVLTAVLMFSQLGCAKDEFWHSDMDDYKEHPCNRQCEDDALPQLCKYDFVVENYYVLSKACHNCPFNQSDCFLPHCVPADGVIRGIKTVNRMVPGPAIQVCEGDTIEVKVDNRLESSEGTSIHWHGILQHGTPHMDGTTLLTQCPITFNSQFTYRFTAVDPGTHYWHAHSGVQRSDGIFGPLIIRRPPKKNPFFDHYNHDLPEHVITVTDWTVDMGTSRLAKYVHYDYDNKPRLMLINGMGKHQDNTTEGNNSTYFTPRASFTVSPGQLYRFRVISSGIMNCPIQFSIDNHTMKVIASDGNFFDPFNTDSFVINSGERYDFILHAHTNSTLRNYWIRARGYNNCAKRKAGQTAILKYKGAPEVDPEGSTTWEDGERGGIIFNSALVESSVNSAEIKDMKSLEDDDDTLTAKPDRKFFMAIDFLSVGNERSHHPVYYPFESSRKFYSPQLNWISNQMPSSPLLSQYDDIPQEMFCNAETVRKDCKKEWCKCVHLYEVSLGDLVEVIVVDEGKLSHAYHPMHLHGHRFRVVGMDRLGTSISLDDVKDMDVKGLLNRTITRAPLKDTVIIPDGGYTIIRFKADNPGFWLFHCHVEYHSETGMAMTFKVGTAEQLPAKPKNFPTCGIWKFDGYESQDGNNNGNSAMSARFGHREYYSLFVLVLYSIFSPALCRISYF